MIIKPRRWLCKRDYIMDDGVRAFIKGKQYVEVGRCEFAGGSVDVDLTNEEGTWHSMDLERDMWPNFEEVQEEVQSVTNA